METATHRRQNKENQTQYIQYTLEHQTTTLTDAKHATRTSQQAIACMRTYAKPTTNAGQKTNGCPNRAKGRLYNIT